VGEEGLPPSISDDQLHSDRPGVRRGLTILGVGLLAWVVPVAVVGLGFGWGSIFVDHPTEGDVITVLTWSTIGYGAALSAVLAVLLALLLARERRATVLLGVAAGAFVGPVAWNAVLRATAANQFFVDAPIAVFPVSWQDTGSGVFALAALAVLLGFSAPPGRSPRRVAALALLGAVSALLVDIYLY
jgi:hypothetical protein